VFLSGSIFPVNQLPWFLRFIPTISPLTYLNDGLRAVMVTGNNEAAQQKDGLCVVSLALAVACARDQAGGLSCKGRPGLTRLF
jgi:ABC-type polysaccharide/polyol phosphate export permease